MSKLDKISIFISFLALWINSFFNAQIQLYIGFVIIFLVGILHGSNDVLLLNKTYGTNFISNKRVIFYYILTVLFGVFLFNFLPSLALLLFIVVSSYHFGEQHWQFKESKKSIALMPFFQIIYGFSILMLLFQSHEIEVKNIVLTITGHSIMAFNFNFILFGTLLSLILIGFALYLKLHAFKKKILINVFYLLVFTLIFKTSNLIWAFAIYFVIWHSLPSIRDQISFIYSDINLNTTIRYLSTALPFWIVSLIGILILYLFLNDKTIFESLFFSLLAAITFPHVFIIIKMFRIKQKTE